MDRTRPDGKQIHAELSGLAERLREANAEGAAAYRPIVDEIVRTQSKDVNAIEHTLDGLLDFCGDDEALALFRRLCGYYADIDPAAAAWHVNAYREWYGADGVDAPDGSVLIIEGRIVAVRRHGGGSRQIRIQVAVHQVCVPGPAATPFVALPDWQRRLPLEDGCVVLDADGQHLRTDAVPPFRVVVAARNRGGRWTATAIDIRSDDGADA